MILRQPEVTLTDTLVPDTTRCRTSRRDLAKPCASVRDTPYGWGHEARYTFQNRAPFRDRRRFPVGLDAHRFGPASCAERRRRFRYLCSVVMAQGAGARRVAHDLRPRDGGADRKSTR